MFRRRLVFWILTVCLLAVAIPAMGERAPPFDTWWETAEYLRSCTQDRAKEIRFTLSEPEALTMQKSDLRQEFLQMAPLMSRLYASIDYDRNSVKVVITPVYRAGVRMLDAWRTGDESALSHQERSALDEAEAIVERLQARYSSSLELERAIFDELCAQLTFNEMLEKEPGEDAPGVSAAFALTHGWANCQGYSDAFYLLAGMAGFEVGFQNGYNAGVLHAWNTVELGGQWYVVDVSTADIAGDLVAPETGVYTLFNAGRDRCAGALSWDPVWETADIADGSGGSYFFHAGIPGFGATFDDLDLMAQYCYNKRAYDGERDIWVLLLGYGEELPIDGINAAMTRVTNQHSGATRWRFWGWPTGGAQCILLRWDVF